MTTETLIVDDPPTDTAGALPEPTAPQSHPNPEPKVRSLTSRRTWTVIGLVLALVAAFVAGRVSDGGAAVSPERIPAAQTTAASAAATRADGVSGVAAVAQAAALGSPFGLDQTVTAGIVSAVNRPIKGVPMVQTDAAINPGNSGGPLLDANARVIGINDVIFTEGGGSDGIGFAVAIDLAIVVAEQLTSGIDVELSSLGASTILAANGEGGAIIRGIGERSPAEEAGLEVGDRIVAFDGDRIDNPSQLMSAVLTHRPETVVTIDFVRDGDRLSAEATLAGIEP